MGARRAASLVRWIASIGAGLGLLGASIAAPLGHSELAKASSTVDTATFNYTRSTQTFTVPQGVTQLDYTVAGGAGGSGFAVVAGASGGAVGDGMVVGGTLSVTPGEKLIIDVGSQGGNASSTNVSCRSVGEQYEGGAAGLNPNASYDGGAGGDGECVARGFNTGGGGGGGGAASVILNASNQALVVAAGGGGGGGAGEAAGYNGGNGGGNSDGGDGSGLDPGSGGQQGSETSSTGGVGGTYKPTAVLQDAGGGGGGGGGINGGAGGDPGGFDGGGGGGGGAGTSTTGSNVTSVPFNTGNGYVDLSWTVASPPQSLSASVSATSSPNPAYVGDNVTFSVSVTGSGSTSPVTGTAFVEAPGPTPQSEFVPVATVPINNGTGSVTLPVLDVALILQVEEGGAWPYGVTSLPVFFYGSGSWQGVDASSSMGVGLSLDPTSTSLAVTPASPVAGQPVTLTATVQNQAQASPGFPPSGTVSFTVTDAMGKTTTLGTASVSSSGEATLSGVTLPAGADMVTASYGGDQVHEPSSTSNAVVVTTPVSMSVAATPSSSSYGAAETLTASIPGQSQGSVTFSLIQGTSTQVLGTEPVTSSQTAELVTSSLPVGTDEILAAYTSPGTSGGPSAFAATTVTVVQDVPTISILGPTSVAPGSSEAYTIDVTANGQPVAGGLLQVLLGGTSFVTTLRSDGVATVSLTFPAILGTQVISAMYLGSQTVAMASNTLSVTVASSTPTTSGQSSSLPPATSSGSTTAPSSSTSSGVSSPSSEAPKPTTAPSSVSVPTASTGESFASPWWWVLSGLGAGAGSVVVVTAWRRRSRTHRIV